MSMFSSRAWREYPQRYRLEAVKFAKSGKTYYPPRTIDPATGETKSEKVVLPYEGKIVTYTVVRIPPSQWNDIGPYALCLVELTDGTKVMVQMADVDLNEVKIGMEVRLEFRRVQTEGNAGVLSYAHKAVPKWY